MPPKVFSLNRTFPRSLVRAALPVLLLGAALSAAVVVSWGARQPLRGDGVEYLDIAGGLAAGKGFVSPHGLWPTQPHMRPPLWPVILSVPRLLFPSADPVVLGLWTEVVMMTGAAAALIGLTWMLSGSVPLACAAGLAIFLYPVSIVLMVPLGGEPAALFAFVAGILLVLRGGRMLYAGAAVLALVPMARPEFAILPFTLAVAAVLVVRRAGVWRLIFNRSTVLAAALFFVPLSAWLAHNYFVFGRFPAMAPAVEGETFYGCYNTLTANSLEYWGYWVPPETLPGEQPKSVLAKRMASELELNDYYRAKGMEFIRNNWFLLPRLVVGRFNRAFVPVPWRPWLPSYAASFCRVLLDVAFLLALRRSWPVICPLFKVFWVGTFLVVLTTTALYWGNFRFVYPLETLMIPFVAVAVVRRRAPVARSAAA